MFKTIVLLAIIATVCGVPTPPPSAPIIETTPSNLIRESAANLPAVQEEAQFNEKQPTGPITNAETKPVAAVTKAVNGEEDPKNEKEELEGAEFGWGLPSWGWRYPSYQTYYPEYYPNYYPSYREYRYWW